MYKKKIKRLMEETLMCLFMVAKEFCPRLGGEGTSGAMEGTIPFATDLLCDLVTRHPPVLAFSFRRNAILLSLTGGEVHKPASDVVDPPR